MEHLIVAVIIGNLAILIGNLRTFIWGNRPWRDEKGEKVYRFRDLKAATVYHSETREDDTLLLDLYRRQLTLLPAGEVINRACALHLELMILRRRLRLLEGTLDAGLLSQETEDRAGG